MGRGDASESGRLATCDHGVDGQEPGGAEDFDLTNLKPGANDDAMAFKPDPAFPDFKDPFRPQLIMVSFWSKSDPKDNSPRTQWLRRARETFDFAAVAALLR